MKNSIFSSDRIVVVLSPLCLMLILTACGYRVSEPLWHDPEFVKAGVREPVYLMPVVDLRVDKTKILRLDDNAMKRLSPIFQKKGYAPLRPLIDRELVESLIEDDFTQPDSSLLANLGPVEAQWLFCPLLHDFNSKITFGSTANAEISGYIIDKKRGKIVWRHKGVGQAGEGGLLGMAMKGLVQEEAVNNAFLSLGAAIPSNVALVSLNAKE